MRLLAMFSREFRQLENRTPGLAKSLPHDDGRARRRHVFLTAPAPKEKRPRFREAVSEGGVMRYV
jgi:hypothetical protein